MKALALYSLFIKVAVIQVFNFIKKRLRCFTVNIAKFWLLLPLYQSLLVA